MKPVKPASEIVEELKARNLFSLAETVAKRYDLTVEEIAGRCRQPAVCEGRRLFWAILYERGNWTTSRIGHLFGVRPNTVAIALQKVKVSNVRAVEHSVGVVQ